MLIEFDVTDPSQYRVFGLAERTNNQQLRGSKTTARHRFTLPRTSTQYFFFFSFLDWVFCITFPLLTPIFCKCIITIYCNTLCIE